MGQQKRLRRGTGVITGPIMDQKQVLRGLCHDPLQEGLVTVRVKPALDALIEQTPRKILNGAEDLIPFAFATGGDLRLVPPSCPGVAERAPLSKTGFIFKQDQAFHTFGCPYNRWPLVPQPSQALGGVKMVRHKARLLKRKAQVVQQGTDIVAVVQHPKLTPDQDPDEERVPKIGRASSRE